MLGLIASAPALEMAMVYPSGGDFATASVPVTPPCPERFSITIGCLRISDMRWPTTRAMMSFGPPGGKGTINLIDLLGKSCAMADTGHSSAKPISSGLKDFTSVLPLFIQRTTTPVLRHLMPLTSTSASVDATRSCPARAGAPGTRENSSPVSGADLICLRPAQSRGVIMRRLMMEQDAAPAGGR